MYKSRIAKWGLVKNRREEDMLFILHKTRTRDALGKNSRFVVRGMYSLCNFFLFL
jgi:hypothetical protein